MSASKHHVYHRLQLAAHALKKNADRVVLESANLTTAQAAVLGVVRSGKQLTQKEIATQLNLNESAVTAMVNRLMKLSYLERQRSESDARSWLINVSANGLTALTAMQGPFSKINETLDLAIPGTQMDDLVDCLNKIIDAFESD